ncbi:hypothetical protein L1281_002552 [Neisseria sp. HSC-16F19]|nr:hypothetical protein [Neisseria sp. HSC-16F19]MCP2041934.1 hypothetical protein [Neisseria sp. HSC-16F19]
MSHAEDTTTDTDGNQDTLYQSAKERDSFHATEQAYGGREAYARAKEAGQTELTYRQWVQVRTPEFKAWFGDWEIGAATAEREARTFSEARKQAEAFKGKPLTNNATGIVAKVSRNNLDKMFNSSAVAKSQSPAVHSAAVANLDRLFERAVLGWSKPDRDNDPNIVAIHRFFAPIVYDGKPMLAKMTVKELRQSDNGVYSVEAVEFNEGGNSAEWVAEAARLDGVETNNPLQREWVRQDGETLAQPHGKHPGSSVEDVVSLAQRIQEYNPDAVSKVTNPRTGEPLVVYHGTQSDFDTFRETGATDSGWYGKGFYFTEDASTASSYSLMYAKEGQPDNTPSVMPAFINSKNPLIQDVEQTETDGMLMFDEAQAEIDKNGHDGAIVLRNGVMEEVMVQSANQIKSATANDGAFSADNDSILYQLDASENSAFVAAVDKAERGEAVGGYIQVGTTPAVLKMLGLPDVNVTIKGETFKKAMGGKHSMTAQAMKRLPIEINNPVAVMRSSTQPNGYVILTELIEQEKGRDKPVIAALHLNMDANGIELLNIASVYGRSLKQVQRGLDNDLLYLNTQKGLQLADTFGLQLPASVSADANLDANIKTEADLAQSLYQNSSNPRGMFDRNSNTIAVLRHADASTFAHELGHFFLEMHTDLALELQGRADLTAAQQQLVQDMQTVMDWFGVENVAAWKALTLEEQRENHERFARGFEAYMFEGKAPSNALRDVFRRFAAWLQHVYRSLTALNVDLTDDVRAVYGRMLASDAQVEQSEYTHGMKPMFDTAEAMGVDAASFAAYQETQAEAQAQAREALRGRALRDLAFVRNMRNRVIRKLKKQHKEDFNRAEMDAKRSIMSQPVYRAWQLLTARMDEANRLTETAEQKEFKRKAKVLQGAPVYSVETRSAPKDNKELHKWAVSLFDAHGNSAVNPEIGEVALTERSVKDSMAHGMNPGKAMAFEAVPSVIERGVLVAQSEHDGVKSYFISAPVRILGDADIATVLVREDTNTRRMYLHSVTFKEKLLNKAVNESVADTEVSQPHGKLYSGDVANILRRYLNVNLKKPAPGKAADLTTDSLFVAIAKLGGLNKAELVAQWGLDPKDKIHPPVFGMPLLRRDKGRSLDAMLEVLAEAGYLPLDNHGKADMRDFEERFFDELRGTPRYSSAYVPQTDKKAGEDVPNIFALTAARLDYASLQEMGFNAQALEVLQERGMVLKSGGLHPDFVAEIVRDADGQPEFATGEDLVLAILQAEPPQEAIEQTAYLNVLAEKGEVPTQADFEQAADLAAHNDLRARILAAEFKALSDAVGSVSLIKRAAQSYARDKVDGIKLSELRPHRYTQAEARAAKQAERALAFGDTAQAANHKRSQLVQNALARAALEARDNARRQKRELSEIGRRTLKKTAKSYDADLMSAAKSIVGMFGIAPRSAEYAAAHLEKVQEYNPEAYNLAVGVLARAQELAYKADGQFDNLTVAEAQGLYDDIQALRHLAKTAHDAVIDGKRADIRDIQAALRERMEKLPQRFKEMGRKRTPTDAEKKMWDFYQWGAALRRVENWAEAMDGGFGGEFSRYVFQPIKEASDNYRSDKAVYLKQFRDIIQGVKFGKAQISAPELGDGFTFKNHNELMHALLHTGNASNKRKLLIGYGWGSLNADGSLNSAKWDAFVERMIAEGKLSKQHFDVAQQIWDLMEALKPKAQATHHAVYGYYFDEITAEPFKTPWGEYRGGYIPAVKDGMLNAQADIRKLEEVAQENVQGMFPTTNKGFTKNRVEGADDKLILDLGTLGVHIDKVLRFSHLEMPLRQVKRTLKGIETEIEQVSPGAVGGMLVPWLHRVSTQQVATRGVKDGGFSSVLTTMRNRAGMAAMVMNLPNAAQQLAGFPLATAKVKPRYLVSAMVDYVQAPRQMSRAVSEASQYMDARLHNQIGLMTEQIERILIDPNWFQRLNQWSQDNAYFAQSAVDNIMAPVIWTGAYNQATEQGMSHKDAVRFADSVIRETQGSVLVEDVSRVETGSPLTRLFTQFYGYFNMLGNLMLTETLNIKRNTQGSEKAAKLAYLWGVAYYGNAVVAELMMGLTRGGYDDEDNDGELDDWLREVLLLSPIKTGIGTVPQLGNVWNLLDGKPYNDRGLSAPVVSLGENAVRAVRRGWNIEKHSDVRDVASLLALFGWAWAPAAARPVGYMTGVANDDIRPTSPVDAVRGTLTGVPSAESRK